MKTIPTILLALWAVAFLLSCSEDVFESISPDIVVYETSPDKPLTALDFGQVAQQNTLARSFFIRNTVQDSADLKFTIALLDSAGKDTTSKVVTFEPATGAVKGDKALSVKATFAPVEEKPYSFTMKVTSNALTKAKQTILIPVTGTGITPKITIVDKVLDFGDVFLSASTGLGTTIRNDGKGTLTISAVNVVNPDGAFSISEPDLRTLPIKIEPGKDISFALIFTPLAVQAYSATFTFSCDDPTNRAPIVTAKGNGVPPPVNKPPDAKIDCPADGFQLPVPGELTLDGTGTTDPNNDAFTYKWTVAKDAGGKELVPDGSDYCFDCNRGQLTHHKDSDKAKPQFFGDVVGDYTVQLVATDENTPPLSSDPPATCVIHGYASQQVHIEMLWDNPVSDLDLHLVNNSDGIVFIPPETGGIFTCPCDCNTNRDRNPDWGVRVPYTAACKNPDGNACDPACSPTFDPSCKIDPNDPATARNPICYKGGEQCVLTCEPDASSPQYQDAVDDNPKLDIDDTHGYGPENINIVKPSPGLYRVFVHYFDDYGTGSSGATVRVYLNGKTKPEWKLGPTVLTKKGQLWEVAIIQWPASKTEEPLVTKVDAVRDAQPVYGAVCKLPTGGGADAGDADAGAAPDAGPADGGAAD